MENKENIVVVDQQSDALMEFGYDNIIAVAERADRVINALNKIMTAAIKITTEYDWCLIGGKPYLQESGATKVARLFGIGWKILERWQEVDSEGYPTYFYRMAFAMGKTTIECDGSRSARDDFFAGAKVDKDGKPKKQKSLDEIDLRDVQQAAYTNCLNNGIKRLIPGLRNIDIKALEEAGLEVNKISGFVFKDGAKGGATKKAAAESGLVCEGCGKEITQKVASYSMGKFGRKYCMSCQKNVPEPPAEYDDGRFDDLPEPPPGY